MGASQTIGSGTRSGTTPVPYPRSIPPFHTCLDPFHTFAPYLWSVRFAIYRGVAYIYIYIYICMILHLYARAHIHTWVHTCKNTFTIPKPCDCVGKSVPAALTAATYFVVWWWGCAWLLPSGSLRMHCLTCGRFAPAPLTVAACCGTAVMFDGRDALGCCQLAV